MGKYSIKQDLEKRFKNWKSQAKQRNIDFGITKEYVFQLLEESRFTCPVSGVEFGSADHIETPGSKNPFAMSLDRVDSSKGYEEGNIRVVCYWVNNALNEWGDDVFWTMIDNTSRTKHITKPIVSRTKNRARSRERRGPKRVVAKGRTYWYDPKGNRISEVEALAIRAQLGKL